MFNENPTWVYGRRGLFFNKLKHFLFLFIWSFFKFSLLMRCVCVIVAITGAGAAVAVISVCCCCFLLLLLLNSLHTSFHWNVLYLMLIQLTRFIHLCDWMGVYVCMRCVYITHDNLNHILFCGLFSFFCLPHFAVGRFKFHFQACTALLFTHCSYTYFNCMCSLATGISSDTHDFFFFI